MSFFEEFEEEEFNPQDSVNGFSFVEDEGFGGFFSEEGFSDGAGDIGAEEFFLSPKEAKAKAAAEKKAEAEAKKKAEKEKKAEAKSKKPVNDCEVELPVQVKARGFNCMVPGEGKVKLSEIRKKLLELGYDQFKISSMGLFYHERSKNIYVCDNSVVSSLPDTFVTMKEGATVTVCDGLIKAEFTLENFDGKEADEVSVADLIAAWVAVNPMYKGCKLAYDEASATAYPVLDGVEEKNFNPQKYTDIVVEGNSQVIEEESSYKELYDSFKGVLTDMASDNVSLKLYEAESGYLFVSYASYKAMSNSSVAVKSTPKKVEQKYKLPLTLFVVTWGGSYQLTSEMFGGKEKVTIKEIRKVMEPVEPIFADESRKVDAYYREKENTLSIMFVSGTKGCELIRTAEELEEVKKMSDFDGHFYDGTRDIRIRALPHGNFITVRGSGRELLDIKGVSFERKLPKIPAKLLDEVISFFREDLSKEAAVMVLYNKEKKEYSFLRAFGFFTKTHAKYEYPSDFDLMCGRKIKVMEIHSHNTMNAFFSPDDDKDEASYPGLFGVIGKLDKEPQAKFRAGVDGRFVSVPTEELFN